MIAIISSHARERAAFAALCHSRGRACVEADSLQAFRHLLHDTSLRIVLTRQRLRDAFSDEVFSALIASGQFAEARVIVLLEAGTTSAQEARQIELGASTVLRDPIRTEVLVAYLDKYWSEATSGRLTASHSASPLGTFEFAGTTVHPLERTATRGSLSLRVTPRELALLKFLFEARGRVVTYQTLYADMLGRRYRGDSGNLRVLFAKLVASYAMLGVSLRRHVQVIAKTGYRYEPDVVPSEDGPGCKCVAQTAPAIPIALRINGKIT